jgi:hypothetical protein
MSVYPQLAAVCCPCPCAVPTPCCPPPPEPCELSLCAPTGPSGPTGQGSTRAFSAGYFAAATKAIAQAPNATQVVFNQALAGTSPAFYSTVSGYMTAPASGLYFVSPAVDVVFILSGSASRDIVTVSLLRNGVAVRSAFVAAPDAPPAAAIPRATAGFATVVSLLAGDVLSVQASSAAAVSVLGAALAPTFFASLSAIALF